MVYDAILLVRQERYFEYFYRPQRSWAKVMFLPVSVILSTGGVCLSACWDATSPLGADLPGADTPWSRPPRPDPPGADTPRTRPPGEQTPPWTRTPRSRHHPLLPSRTPRPDPPGSDTPSPGADTRPPRSRHHPPLGVDTTPRGRPPRSRPPQEQTPLGADPPGSRPTREQTPAYGQ